MNPINCNIIRDILPLYLDNVVCSDTKEMVEEHLHACPDCQKEANSLQSTLVLPANNSPKLFDAQPLKALKKTLFKKKVIVSVLSVLIAIAVLASVYALLFFPRVYLPYDSSRITIEERDGQLYANCNGINLSGSAFLHSVPVTIEGKETSVSVLYYYTSPWSHYIAPFFGSNRAQPQKHILFLDDTDKVDQIYYGNYNKGQFKSLSPAQLAQWDLIWEKDETTITQPKP